MAKKNLDFSIIIRGRNEAHWLKILLYTLKKQTIKNFEIIFCNNRSQDESVQLLKKYKVKKIVDIKNYKPGKSINSGIKKSKGKYIIILSSHCIPSDEKWLEEYLKFFKKNTRIAACYGKQLPLPGTSSKDALDLNIVFKDNEIIGADDIYFNNANAAYKSEFLKKNLFNEKLTNIEDRIWAIETIKKKQKIAYTASSPVYHIHGIHQHNASSQRSDTTSKIIKKFYDFNWNNCEFIKQKFYNFILLVNARRENKLSDIIKKINYIIKDKRLKIKKLRKIIVLTSSSIDISKNKNNKFNFFKAKKSVEMDVKSLYKNNLNLWVDVNYILYLNISFNININKINKLTNYSCQNTVESATLAEKFYGNFEVIFKDGSIVKSMSLEERSEKPWIRIMHWTNGCILIPFILSQGKLTNENTKFVY